MSEARQAFRQVLRAVDKHLTSVNGNKQWRNYIRQEFKRASAVSTLEEQQQQLQEVKDYTHLVNSVQEHKVSTQAHCALTAGSDMILQRAVVCCHRPCYFPTTSV